MSEGAYSKKHHQFCSEFYTVEKTIELTVEIEGRNEIIRIEALRNEKFPEDAVYEFSIRSYIQRDVAGETCWVHWSRLSWAHSNTADSTLKQALAQLHSFVVGAK